MVMLIHVSSVFHTSSYGRSYTGYSYSYLSNSITNYITNYLCFIALSVEICIILYVKYVTAILFIDTVVLIGLLLMAVREKTLR